MGRPIGIIMPDERPYSCDRCPVCGVRPKEELQPADKWTHKCIADGRLLSGRGIHQPNARNRCTKRQYEKLYFTKQGVLKVSAATMKRYGLQQTKLYFKESVNSEQ